MIETHYSIRRDSCLECAMTSADGLIQPRTMSTLPRALLLSEVAPAATVFLALMLFFSIKAPDHFATIDNLRNITVDFSFLLILAVGMTFVIVTAGIDLSIGAVLVVASVVSNKAMIA